MMLSVPVLRGSILSELAESIILSAPPAESMIVSAPLAGKTIELVGSELGGLRLRESCKSVITILVI
jgi:hypothetical protein